MGHINGEKVIDARDLRSKSIDHPCRHQATLLRLLSTIVLVDLLHSQIDEDELELSHVCRTSNASLARSSQAFIFCGVVCLFVCLFVMLFVCLFC